MKQLKKMLKNNKGVTLVELIISTAILFLVITAFLSMVASATKMFNKGQRELDVQDEAQIVTNQIENLLTDAQLYAGQVGNDIYIVNEDLVHVVSQASDGVYYTVYDFPAAEDKTTENVKDLLATNPGALRVNTHLGRSLLSKRMTNLTLDTSDLDDDSIVYLSMTYKNQEREIPVSQSIYMRNKPGSEGGHGHTDPNDNDFDAELTVLRFKTHNLRNEFGIDSISRNGSSPVISGADANNYDIDLSANTIALKSSVSAGASSAGGATITCTKGGQPFKIRLSFDPITIGLSGPDPQTSTVKLANVETSVDYIAIKGFDTHSDKVRYTVSVTVAPSSGASGNTYSAGTSSNPLKIGSTVNDIEKSLNYAGGYFNGVYRLMLDDQSNHLRFLQTGQGTIQPNGAHPVVVYTINLYYNNGSSYQLLGSTRMKIVSP